VIQAATSDKTGSAPGYVRIGFDDRQQIAKPFPLNAPLTIDLGGEQVGSIAWIDVGLMDGSSCGYGGSGVDLDSVDIAVDGTTLNIGRPQLGSDGSGSTLASLSGGRSSFNVYSRCPAEDDGTCEPTQKYLHTSPATLAHLRIRLKPGGGTSLRSQSALAHGARVTGALCAKPDCSDVTDKCVGAAVNASPMTVDPHRHFTVTPAGGWPGGQEIDQYVAYDPGAIGKVAAVALCISERDLAQETLEIDEIDVDDVQDPIRTWAADYDDLQKQVFANTDGKIALGTDENGLSSQFQFSDFVPSYAVDGASCGTTTGGAGIAAAQYGDADRGGVYTLERPLRIGSTPLCLPTRGMASYGMLPEVFAAVYRQDTNAYRSLFRSASGLIKAWRATRAAAFAATTNVLSCPDDGGAVDGALEGGAPDALGDSASGDGGADQ
jgi:hypothetical protein